MCIYLTNSVRQWEQKVCPPCTSSPTHCFDSLEHTCLSDGRTEEPDSSNEREECAVQSGTGRPKSLQARDPKDFTKVYSEQLIKACETKLLLTLFSRRCPLLAPARGCEQLLSGFSLCWHGVGRWITTLVCSQTEHISVPISLFNLLKSIQYDQVPQYQSASIFSYRRGSKNTSTVSFKPPKAVKHQHTRTL